jgi:hypothetical protein
MSTEKLQEKVEQARRLYDALELEDDPAAADALLNELLSVGDDPEPEPETAPEDDRPPTKRDFPRINQPLTPPPDPREQAIEETDSRIAELTETRNKNVETVSTFRDFIRENVGKPDADTQERVRNAREEIERMAAEASQANIEIQNLARERPFVGLTDDSMASEVDQLALDMEDREASIRDLRNEGRNVRADLLQQEQAQAEQRGIELQVALDRRRQRNELDQRLRQSAAREVAEEIRKDDAEKLETAKYRGASPYQMDQLREAFSIPPEERAEFDDMVNDRHAQELERINRIARGLRQERGE